MSGYDQSAPVIDCSSVDEEVEERKTQRRPLAGWLFSKLWILTSWLDSKAPFSLTLKILVFVLIFTWFGLIGVRHGSINELDLGWHLRSGEWIMQHHQLPLTDPFSITGGTAPWVAYSWPFSVLIYEIGRNFDLQGIALFSFFAWMAIVIALFVLARGRGASFWRAAGLVFIAGNIMPRVVSPRPGPITILLFIVMFDILLREREKGYTRVVYAIPFLIWAWANIHVQFVYGLFVVGLFCIEPILDWLFLKRGQPQKFSPRLWAVLCVSTAATFLNPYGFGPYQVIIDFLNQPLLAQLVLETRAMEFDNLLHFFVLFLSLGAAFVLGRRSGVLRPLWVFLLIWVAISGFRMERDIWLITTITLAIIATPPPERQPEPRLPSRLLLYGSLGVFLAIALLIYRVPSNKVLLSLIAPKLPVGAVAYIHEHNLKGPLFNDYDWGGFLIYALPEIKVSMDGRTNVHDQYEVVRDINTWTLRPGWNRNPLLNNANLVIGTPHKALTSYLETDPHFKVVFNDGVGVLFERVLPGKVGPITAK